MRYSQWFESRSYKDIIKALDHPEFYARNIESIKRETGLTKDEIKKAIKDKPINTFTFGGIEYIGTKDREKIYDQDKKLGINPFETDTYKGDDYREKVLKSKPRFR